LTPTAAAETLPLDVEKSRGVEGVASVKIDT
jgi:hypothetical protein